MDRSAILEKVTTIICDTIDVDASTVAEATTFDDLGADSLDRLELVTAFEDEFGLTIPDEDLEKISSVKDAVDAIANAQ